MANGHGGKRPGAGRKQGQRPQYKLEIEAYSREIVEDEKVRKRILEQARAGELPPGVLQMFYHYAYGKPVEHVQHSGDTEHPLQIVIRRAPRPDTSH